MQRIKAWFVPYIRELEKVKWPKWGELQVNTITVLIASFLLAVIIAVMDLIAQNIMTFLYDIF